MNMYVWFRDLLMYFEVKRGSPEGLVVCLLYTEPIRAKLKVFVFYMLTLTLL